MMQVPCPIFTSLLQPVLRRKSFAFRFNDRQRHRFCVGLERATQNVVSPPLWPPPPLAIHNVHRRKRFLNSNIRTLPAALKECRVDQIESCLCFVSGHRLGRLWRALCGIEASATKNDVERYQSRQLGTIRYETELGNVVDLLLARRRPLPPSLNCAPRPQRNSLRVRISGCSIIT